MANEESFPYETRLNILCRPLEVVDEQALADACTYKWYNQTLCQVNGSVVRLGVVQGEYHWHKHDDDDEFFTSWPANSTSTSKAARSHSRRGRAW